MRIKNMPGGYRYIYIIIAVCVAAFVRVDAYADTIVKKNGTTIDARVVARTGDTIWYKAAGGRAEGNLGVDAKDVAVVKDDNGKVSHYSPRPEILLSVSPRELTTGGNIVFSVESADPYRGEFVEYSWRLDDEGLPSKEKVCLFKPGTLAVGEHFLEVKAKDSYDVWSDALKQEFIVAKSAPHIALVVLPKKPSTTDTIFFRAEAVDYDKDEIVGYEWRFDNRLLKFHGKSFKLLPGVIRAGSHSFLVRAKDSDGLWSKAAIETVVVKHPAASLDAFISEVGPAGKIGRVTEEIKKVIAIVKPQYKEASGRPQKIAGIKPAGAERSGPADMGKEPPIKKTAMEAKDVFARQAKRSAGPQAVLKAFNAGFAKTPAANGSAPKKLRGIMLIIVFLPLVLAYAYFSLCLHIIARKTSTRFAWLAWLPGINLFLMVNIAKKPKPWLFILGLLLLLGCVPILNIIAGFALFIFMIILWCGMAAARNKPSWVGLLIFVPVINVLLPAYLAFSE